MEMQTNNICVVCKKPISPFVPSTSYCSKLCETSAGSFLRYFTNEVFKTK